MVSNLSILFFFKYVNFTIDVLTKVLSGVNVSVEIPTVSFLLPVGISFYTFQALSYTMDVYRDEIYAEKNFLRYALFVSFFPQLVAGPIERSKNLLKQLAIPKNFDFDNFREGVLLMLWGYFLKIVLTDRISVFVDAVYGNYIKYTGWYIIIATILFAFQIYCDFAGYSTIAMGSAKMLGIELMENFDAPYLSLTVSDFWRSWHISLTSWFKDYLYIPLGGNRKGKIRKYINKMIVFLISGLWHGALFSFVIWGGINGLYQVISEVTLPLRKKACSFLRLNSESMGHKMMKVFVTFILVDFFWIFFRARRAKEAFDIIKNMLDIRNIWILFDGSLYTLGLDIKNYWLMINGIIILFAADYLKRKGIKIREVILKQDYWFRYAFFIFAILGLMLFGKWGPAFDNVECQVKLTHIYV